MCISAAKPLRSLVPAFDRLMPGHAVQDSMPLPLNQLSSHPESAQKYGQRSLANAGVSGSKAKRRGRPALQDGPHEG
jgi:hypothetical protein